MIIAIKLPDAITPRHVDTLFAWLRGRAPKLRPWIETYVCAEAAREGIEVPEGAALAVFDAVLRAMGEIMAWPSMSEATQQGARDWYRQNV